MFKKIKFPKRDPFNRELRKLTMCRKCYSFYYKSFWHFEAPLAIQEDNDEKEIPVRFSQCPACIELEVALYERDNDLVSYGV